jgi:hypothetical protein
VFVTAVNENVAVTGGSEFQTLFERLSVHSTTYALPARERKEKEIAYGSTETLVILNTLEIENGSVQATYSA